MATKKKLLQAAAGSAGGAGPLNVEDVFSSYLYDGNNESQAIENGINLGQSNDGTSVIMNLYTSADSLTSSDDTDSLFINDNNIIDFGTGDFTFECWVWTKDYGGSTYNDIAGGNSSEFGLGIYGGTLYYSKNGVVNPLQADVTTKLNQWMHIAVSRSSGTSKLFVDGVEEQSTSDTNSFASANGVHIGRLGTRSYKHQGYISNVRIVKGTGIYTSAFTPPTSELTAVSGTALLLCNGDNPLEDTSSNSHSVTKQGNPKTSTFGPFDAATSGEGGLVWIKNRGPDTVSSHSLFDTERGNGARLTTNNSNAQNVNQAYYNTAFNSGGFSIASNADTGTNKAGSEYASWTWRKAPRYFDIVTYSGNGVAGRTVSHNLGAVPGMMIIKRLDSGADWSVYHKDLHASSPASYFLTLNDTSSRIGPVSSQFNDTAPTATEFTLGTGSNTNNSAGTYVAYLFADNDGDGEFGVDEDQDIIKCGTYTGNGGTQEIDIGFEPQWILVKNVDSGTANWVIFDAMINWRRDNGTASYDSVGLEANTTDNEASGTAARFHPSATGFGFKSEAGTWLNTSGNKYIYMAIRRGLMATPTDATKVFAIDDQGESSAPFSISNFPVDFVMRKDKTGSNTELFTRLTQNRRIFANLTNAEDTDNVAFFDFMNGCLDNTATSTNRLSYMWRRANGFFDVVSYFGDGITGRAVPHNLGVEPEMIWVKRRTSTNAWQVYVKEVGNNKRMHLEQTAAAATTGVWDNTTPTATNFYVSSGSGVNHSDGGGYMAYLFATADGVSKVGSYTGNGSTLNIDCGFSSGARFVMIKRTDSSSPWWLWDSERGIVAGNDTFFDLNSNAAETTGFDWLDPYSSGFSITSTGNNNISGGSYIFYAIAA